VFMWTKEKCAREVAEDLEITEKIAVDWLNFCRDVCIAWKEAHPVTLGGFDENLEPIVVEIDETLCFRRKNHVGIPGMQNWIFGAVERETGRCFAISVPNRLAGTLLPIIQEHILPGTHIISDEWASYNTIAQIQNGIYSHSTVNHSQFFFHPLNQGVESL
jgi:hypothetical protein